MAIGVAMWEPMGACPQIFNISFHVVLWEAVSQTKYCFSPKIKIFAPSRNLGWLCHCSWPLL